MGHRRAAAIFAALLAGALLVAGAAPASAHDHRAILDAQSPPNVGAPLAPNPDAVALQAGIDQAAGAPAVAMSGTLTSLPETISTTFTTPADPCEKESCAEFQVDVPEGAKSLYATIGWEQPAYYLHLWGITPKGKVVGRMDASRSYDKEIGNERTIPKAQFTVADPQPGKWRFQVRAVFGYQVSFGGGVAVSDKPPVHYERLGVKELGDRFATQKMRVNLVFVGRTPSADQVKAVKDRLPDRYRAAVLSKAGSGGCEDGDTDDPVGCYAGGNLNWGVTPYGGTRSSKDDKDDDAGGQTPYFEALGWRYDYRFYSASETYTRDLFGAIKDLTTPNQLMPTARKTAFLESYNATRGQFRGPDALVVDARQRDLIDAFAVENWIFANRGDRRYADAFTDLESGNARDGMFITPDSGAYYDPFYDAKGVKDVDRTPQGASNSVTLFVLDTFTTDLAREYFRPDAYHSYGVGKHMIDPDTDEPFGPDDIRFWGGRYRFFFLDIGAMPNNYEAAEAFLRFSPTDSGSYPNGDPPVWEALRNPVWEGEKTLYDRVARNLRTVMFFRFTAPYLYRPVPADVFLLASNNWSDFYSRPEGGGISYTRLEEVYQPDFVERNLAAAVPFATFRTERDEPGLQTFRYLGCSDLRYGSRATVAQGPPVMVPDPTCAEPDPLQRIIEEAKSQGDDLVGAGVPTAVAAGVVRRYIEQHREEFAPLRPGQLTMTSISAVFPGAQGWFIPAIAAGVAFPTPNGEAWGILQSVNDVTKSEGSADCEKSLPASPGCGPTVPDAPVGGGGSGFSYTISHEASHALGLLHPHDSLVVEKNAEGEWDHYGSSYVHLTDFSMAPTTYAGTFAPYSVLDQDILQRGHVAEYLRVAQDYIADAYLADGAAGRDGPSDLTRRRQAEMERWRDQAAALLACGDNLHAEYAARNASMTAQAVFGPSVDPRPLEAGERVLFNIHPQPVYGPDGGAVPGCTPPPAQPGPATASTVVPATALALWGAAVAALRYRRRHR